MEEMLSEERKRRLVKAVTEAVEKDILTNMDALMILQILEDACRKAMTEKYEDIISDRIEGDIE